MRSGIPVRVVEPQPASRSDLGRAHDAAYVCGVMEGRVPNGFGNTDPNINATLPWTSGSLLSAASWAVRHGEAALSPTSGFHHAGWNYGAAYCTFNGLMVAALALHEVRLVRRLAILDLDQHFGDGTRDILHRLGIGWISHYTYGAEPATHTTAAAWLERLPYLVDRSIAGCNLVLYQAGVDPHMDDPLGGALTTEQLARRDRIVFERCRAAGIPVVVNLAGGYQRPVERVVALHVATLREFAGVFD